MEVITPAQIISQITSVDVNISMTIGVDWLIDWLVGFSVLNDWQEDFMSLAKHWFVVQPSQRPQI